MMLRNRAAPIITLIAIAICFGLALTASAQTDGELRGRVYDTKGNVIHDAQVRAVNLKNGNPHTRRTSEDEEGYYIFESLAPGDYQIIASHPNFKSNSISIRVQLNQKFNPILWYITLCPPTQECNPKGTALLDNRRLENNGLNREVAEDVTERDEEFIFRHFSLGNNDDLSSRFDNAESPVVPTQPGPPKVPAGREQLVRTLDATRSTNFSQQQMLSLPLGGATFMRSFDELALLVSGVAPPPYTPGVRGPGIGFGIGTAGAFSVNGMRARSNNFSIDGSDNNDPDVGVRRQGFVGIVPQSLESINDFSISTLLWDAGLGRNIGAQVNAVSKYGGNEYHGQAYVFFTDSRLNAKNAFDFEGGVSGGKDPLTRAEAGFVFEGPIIRNRTQFFVSFEHQHVSASVEQHFSTPSSSERHFLNRSSAFSKFLVDNFSSGSGIRVYGVTSGVTPLGRNILSLYPLPNNPGGPYGPNTYTEVLPADGRGFVSSFRLTHQITDSNSVNARYNFTDDDRTLPSINRAIRSSIGSDSRSQNLSLIFDSEISQSMSSLARFSFGRTRLSFPEYPSSPFTFSASSEEVVETLSGPQPVKSSTGEIGELIIEPFNPVGVNALFFPQGRVNNTFQIADAISWQLKGHSIKFGGDVRRVELNSFQDRLYRPQIIFGNGVLQEAILDTNGAPIPKGASGNFFPGVELAALGLPSSFLQTITTDAPNSTIGLHFTEYSLFLRDTWRIRRNLTFDYGLRYDYDSVPREDNNLIEDSLSLRNLPPAGSFADFKAAVAAYQTVVDGRTRIYNPDRNNFAPRFGFAWDPSGDGKMSVRAGYGVYFDTILGAVVSQSRNVFPRETPLNFFGLSDTIVLFNPPVRLKQICHIELGRCFIERTPFVKEGTNQFVGRPEDFAQLVPVNGQLAFTLPEKNLRTPYAQHWHLTIEKEVLKDYLVSAAYVGTKGTKLTRAVTPNFGPVVTPHLPFLSRFLDSPLIFPAVNFDSISRPIPELGPYQIFENSANSTYHSLQLEANSRYRQNYQFTLTYTWSHAIDDVSDLFPIAGAPVLAQNQKNLGLERGNANFDVRQRFTASFIWELPFYRNSKLPIANWLGGWQAAFISQANTGQPFTLNLPVDANRDGNLTDRPRTIEGLSFFGGHGSRRVAVEEGGDVNEFFVTGEDGRIGRNTVRGDGFVNVDLSLKKTFHFRENQTLAMRAEFFNLLNRSNFALPIRVIGAPGFGSSVDTVNPARIIQFAIKYNF